MNIYAKILTTDVPKVSSVLGPRSFLEVPPTEFEVSVAEFYWPDVKFLAWAPQRWVFDASYLADHPGFPCASFDEPSSVQDVERSSWYLEYAVTNSQTPAKRTAEDQRPVDPVPGSHSGRLMIPLSPGDARQNSGAQPSMVPPLTPTPASRGCPAPHPRSSAYDRMKTAHRGRNRGSR